MNKQPDFKKKADQTLESLEGIQRAEPQPYFFTRLKARLERDEKNIWEVTGTFLARPAIAFSGLCLILAINVFILIKKDTAATQLNAVQNAQVTEDENILAVAGNTYDYENLEP
jgi:hypothetical protein